MKNQEISGIFNAIADILEIKEENRFRIRAYRRAAFNVSAVTVSLDDLARQGALETIPGVGKDLSDKIREYLTTGKISFYEDLKKEVPPAVLEFMSIQGVGPKTAMLFYSKLGIKSIKELREHAALGEIKDVPGLGEKTIENILRGIEFLEKASKFTLLSDGMRISEAVIRQISLAPGVKKIEVAGSTRRAKETIGDVDILASSVTPEPAMEAFIKMPEVKEVLAHGPTRSSIITAENVQVDLRIVPPGSYGAALAYLTGSKAHNIRLREIAVKKNLKLNEYGIFRNKDNKKIASSTEKEIYEALGLAPVQPEMREDQGEIEAALKHAIPDLVTLKDIRSDLHLHTTASDGSASMEELAEACSKKGYTHIVITDHSQSLKVARGLDPARLKEHLKKIDALNKRIKGLRILKGAEVDILADGSLDYDDSILERFDFVIGSIHTGFKQPKGLLTGRIVTAMKNKYLNMIAHPTGRLLGKREGYEIDIPEILKAARGTNTALEINAYPERLDLSGMNCRLAKDAGVMIGIGTDSHRLGDLDYMTLGVRTARRGWLTRKNVLNTLTLQAFLKKIKK